MIKEIHEVYVVLNTVLPEVECVCDTMSKATRYRDAHKHPDDLAIVKRRVR